MAFKGTIRSVKNFSKGFTDAQIKVRNATSNDPWGPSGSEMQELAYLTFQRAEMMQVLDMLDKRLNDKGKNWRHVFKSLTVLDYLVHCGSEDVVNWSKDNIYIIKTLREFQYVDENGKDQGANIRMRAQDLSKLLMDDDQIRRERKNRSGYNERLNQRSSEFMRGKPLSSDYHGTMSGNEDDENLRKALEESRKEAEMEAERQRNGSDDDEDFQKAIKLSKEEEEMRKRREEETNTQEQDGDLLDLTSSSSAAQTVFNQSTGFGVQGQPVDLYGNPILPYQQFQYVSMPPVSYIPQQSQLSPAAYQTFNPYASQPLNGVSNATQNGSLDYSNVKLEPVKTGSNNPFASFASNSGPINEYMRRKSSDSDITKLQFSAQAQATSRPTTTGFGEDPRFSQLAQALATGKQPDVDTFGNTGDTRIPRHYTSGRVITSHATGLSSYAVKNNPFLAPNTQHIGQQQQDMGMRNTQSFGTDRYGSANDRGSQQSDQKETQPGSLIDF